MLTVLSAALVFSVPPVSSATTILSSVTGHTSRFTHAQSAWDNEVHAKSSNAATFIAKQNTSSSSGFRSALGQYFFGCTIRPTVAQMADALDAALRRFDLETSRVQVALDDTGTVVLALNASDFRLTFSIDDDPRESGWGLVTHRSRGGFLFSGPLDTSDFSSIFALVLRPRSLFQLSTRPLATGAPSYALTTQ